MSPLRKILAAAVVVAVVGVGVAFWVTRDERARRSCPDASALEHVQPELGDFSTPLTLEPVAEAVLPTGLAMNPVDRSIWITQVDGVVLKLGEGGAATTELTVEVARDHQEQGMFALAFSPDGQHLYVSYTDAEGTSRIDEYGMVDGGLDEATRRPVFTLHQPHASHNGGAVAFGPDGMLYASFGDGGPLFDPDDRAQDTTNIFGSIIRIDPNRPTGDLGYGIPADNPFAGSDGDAPEIWAYGLRNPWRFSFDSATGAMWIGDVGEFCVEEIDLIPPGEEGLNFGWSRLEGSRDLGDGPPPGYVPPVHEYRNFRDEICSVTGGYVYRGSAIPELQGHYVYADLCVSRLLALRPTDGRDPANGVDGVVDLGVKGSTIASFGVDLDGELYVLNFAGSVSRLAPG